MNTRLRLPHAPLMGVTALLVSGSAFSTPVCYQVGTDTATLGQRLIIDVVKEGKLANADKKETFPTKQTTYSADGKYVVFNPANLTDSPLMSPITGGVIVSAGKSTAGTQSVGSQAGLMVNNVKFFGCSSSTGVCNFQVPFDYECISSDVSPTPTSWTCNQFINTLKADATGAINKVSVNVQLTQVPNTGACRIFWNTETPNPPTPQSAGVRAQISLEEGLPAWLQGQKDLLPGYAEMPKQ
ncbi:MAG: hypothetical protein PHT19_05670 [Methylococcus sp.]|nr:hypothetical protein [Methylococcus sp.]